MVGLPEIEAAALRLRPYIRRTPPLDGGPLPGGGEGSRFTFKLENLQVTGSFKARGAVNNMLFLHIDKVRQGLVT
ncbi:MAG TPA: pyridoxal-5'-phosphate-dependent protein subunit beta, partial [Thermoanaerobaculia bacterium]|nr:pyridoxal-5'-phosphate-dependent protein subunit beta [Thermoanaerobaculia bacterium]